MTRSIPLALLHRSLGAKFGEFAGYEMPIQYPQGLKYEHLHTRAHAGLFDVSHMGQIRVTAKSGGGPVLRRALESILPIDFDGWPSGQQRYSVLLNDQGGIEDDLMLVWRPGPDPEVRMIVNAGNRHHDFQYLQSLAPDLEFQWVDAALVALQGPASEAVLGHLDPKAMALRFMESADLNLLGATCFATRSGYTGEDGYEISMPLDRAEEIVSRLLDDPEVKPVGLGARDTLRLEAGLPLHGQDISPSITPVEAGLRFAIATTRRPSGLKAGGYPGSRRIESQWSEGPHRYLAAFSSQLPTPIRAHSGIFNADDEQVGEVTSGTVSPTLGYPILMALIDARASKQALSARVRGQSLPLVPHTLPFVPKRYKR